MSSSEDDGLGSSGEVFIPHLGWMRFPPPDLVLQHLREGTFEFREQAFVWSFLKPADTFLDVGAHCGLFAKIGTNIISPRGRIVAVEPNDDVLRFLRANLYGCAVDIRPIAITNEIGEASLWKEQDSDAALSSLAYSSPTGIRTTVQTTTLDQLLHDEDIAEVAFVKLDVEGSELAVLKGARSALDRKSNSSFVGGVYRGEFKESRLFGTPISERTDFEWISSLQAVERWRSVQSRDDRRASYLSEHRFYT